MNTPKRFARLSIRVDPAAVELAELWLWEHGATGLEQRDTTTIVLGIDDGRVTLLGSFEDEALAANALAIAPPEYEASLLYDEATDWAVEWRRGFGPQRIGSRLLLQPSWEQVADSEGRTVLTIDPESAFGSGDHETTRLVLSIIDERITGGERVLDVGCGSGVLSIAALALGASSAIGIDIEDDAIAVATRNASLNGVADRFDASTAPLHAVEGKYDLVLANIETRVLVDLPSQLASCVAPDGLLILSGILDFEHDAILRAYEATPVVETRSEGEWLAFVMGGASR